MITVCMYDDCLGWLLSEVSKKKYVIIISTPRSIFYTLCTLGILRTKWTLEKFHYVGSFRFGMKSAFNRLPKLAKLAFLEQNVFKDPIH